MNMTLLVALVVTMVPFAVSAGEWEGPCYKAGGSICAAGREADGTPNVKCGDMVYSGVKWTSVCIYSCDDGFNHQAWSVIRDPEYFYEHCYQDDESHSKKLALCRENHGVRAEVGANGKCACQQYYEPNLSEPFQCVLVGQKCEPTTLYSDSKPTDTVCRCPSGTSLGKDNLTCFPDDARQNSEGVISTGLPAPELLPGETAGIQDGREASDIAAEQTNGEPESVQRPAKPERSWIQWLVDFFRSIFAKLGSK